MKKKNFTILRMALLSVLFTFFFVQVNAQNRTITGNVTAAQDGLGMPGVSVVVKGTTNGTTTDFVGMYTIKSEDIFGIVGSGYNDWSNTGPDFTFTEVNSGIWVAEIVTLIDGDIKFRVNED